MRNLMIFSAAQPAPAAVFPFDPASPLEAPAQHDLVALPKALTLPVDLYVKRRDLPALLFGKTPATDPRHRKALRNFAVYTVPGWGNFTFGARYLDAARAAAGDGLTHVSVSAEGPLWQRGAHAMIGLPKAALAAEWPHELRTVVYRVWYTLKTKKHFTGTLPERELFLGHSKGGLLVYLLACLAKSRKDGRLDEFVNSLRDSRGEKILAGIPREVLDETAEKLSDAVFGSLGSPLFGIAEPFERFSDFGVGPLSFNGVSGDSARYFHADYLRALHRMALYAPEEAMDFVVTSELGDLPRGAQALWRGAGTLGKIALDPLGGGANALFNGFSRVVAPGVRHDGVASSDYPVAFEHHLRVPNATHLDQVEQVWFLRRVLDFLVARDLLQK